MWEQTDADQLDLGLFGFGGLNQVAVEAAFISLARITPASIDEEHECQRTTAVLDDGEADGLI